MHAMIRWAFAAALVMGLPLLAQDKPEEKKADAPDKTEKKMEAKEEKKRVAGPVTGAADVMLFPDLTSANLTVKAIMYTADCRFGGVLRGTAAPVVFMSRADTIETRLNSLALTLRILEHDRGV